MKALIILVLTGVIFGSAAFFTWTLFFKQQHELSVEKALPPPAPPPDPTLPDFERISALQETASSLEVRDAWRDFVERYPQSSRLEEAKQRLGQINSALLFSNTQTPEKSVYVVKPGEVIMKVAAHAKTTPEMILRVNNLQGAMLRIGQRLMIVSANFSLTIDRKHQKVVLLQEGKFFKQYAILTMPVQKKALPPGQKQPKIIGKVADKIAYRNGTRVIFADKGFLDAEHQIIVTPSGNSLYPELPPGASLAPKPIGGGYGLAPESTQELAVVLRKNDPVTIE